MNLLAASFANEKRRHDAAGVSESAVSDDQRLIGQAVSATRGCQIPSNSRTERT